MKKKPWGYYLGFFRESYLKLFLLLLLSLFLSLLVLPIAYLIRNIFDTIIPAANVSLLVYTGLVIILLTLASGIANLWIRYSVLNITKHAIESFRDELLKRLCGSSRTYYSNTDQSKLHAQIVHDSETVDHMSNTLFTQFVPAVAATAVLSMVLIALSWFLFLVLLAVAPVMFFISRRMSRSVRNRVRDFQESFATFSSGVLFVLRGLDLTRIQSAEEFEMERQRKHLEELRHKGRSMAYINAAYHIVQTTIANASGFLLLLIGGISIIGGTTTVGELISFYVVMSLVKAHLHQVSYNFPHLIAGNHALNTLYDFLSIQDLQPYSGRKQIDFQGNIRLENIHFRYGEKPLLRNLDLVVDPGSRIAIIGPNGAGKSTIINLILGFYRPIRGTVYADGHPFSELDLIHFRRYLGVVMQDTMLFPGTILDNITYGYPDVKMEDVIESAEVSTAHSFIQELPLQYETPVGEKGVLLSGGQRQRIALARAMLNRPRLLILDEPTTHLDSAIVQQLVENLQGLNSRPALMIISHDSEIADPIEKKYLLKNGSLLRYSGAEPPAELSSVKHADRKVQPL